MNAIKKTLIGMRDDTHRLRDSTIKQAYEYE